MEEINCRIYNEETYSVSSWAGGTTTQLAIYPETADYVQRDFLWRLSSAKVELEESVFTELPDYNRVLLVLSGETVLAHEGQRVARLAPLQQDRFDGGFQTKCFGQITDYNLMVRKGSEGVLEVLYPEPENRRIGLSDCQGYDGTSVGLYCHEGYSVVTVNGKTHMLKAGSQMVADKKGNQPLSISYMGEGVLIYTCIHYKDGAAGPVAIPEEKGTWADFLAAMKLSLTNFRGGKYIFRSVREVWYDEALKAGIHRLEQFLLPFWICLAGLGLCIFGAEKLLGLEAIVPVVILWLALDLFLITPLLYYCVLPKPIKSHIKAIDSLTEYEKGVYQREQGTNQRTDKLLEKYKITGRNKYVE